MLEQERIGGWWSGLSPVLAPGPVHESLYACMGRLLGLAISDEVDVAFLVQSGVPLGACDRATAAIGVPVGFLGGSPAMPGAARTRLDPDTGDRLFRVVRLHAQAVLMLGNEASARTWMHAPLRWRQGVVRASPLQLALRESGARLAEQLLLRAVHGVH